MSNLDSDSVKRVRHALKDAGQADTVQELPDGVRKVADAAKALGVEPGAVAVSKIFTIGNRYVMVLMSGASACRSDQLPRVFNLQGAVVNPSVDLVRAVTGYPVGGASGGVPPLGLAAKLPLAIDANLKHFDKIFVAAGHGQCVFETKVSALKSLTGGLVSYALADTGAEAKTTS
ncbi:YbaK/EbsC family protein [Pseudomonadota bacterium]